MQHSYEKIEISAIDWNPIEGIISVGDLRNGVMLWSLKTPEYPIYYSKVGMNPVIDVKWIMKVNWCLRLMEGFYMHYHLLQILLDQKHCIL